MEFIGKDDLISSIVNKPSKINRAHWIVSYQSKTKKIQICSHCGKSVEFPCKRKFKSMTVSKWCDPKKVPKKYILVDVTNDEEYAKKRFCCNKCKQVYEE